MESRKWFLQALGHEGLNNLLAAYEDKSAQAVCTFAYLEGPGHEPLIFEGRVLVGWQPSGRRNAEPADPSSQGKIVSARGPPDFGTLIWEVARCLTCAERINALRLGSDLRVYG